MSNELEFLSRYVAQGKLSRRDFLGRAAALGASATFANSLLSSAARAQSMPRRSITALATVPLAKRIGFQSSGMRIEGDDLRARGFAGGEASGEA